MKKSMNFILFRMTKINEDYFSTATKLIEKIERRVSTSDIADLFENDKRYIRIRYIRKTYGENEKEKVFSDVMYKEGDFLVYHQKSFFNALNNNEPFYYLFYYDKHNEIRSNIRELQNFFLIKQIYSNCRFLINDYVEKDSEYFTISHFLYFETLKDRDSVFYRKSKDSRFIRLQEKGIGALTKFIPLIEINSELYHILSMRIGEMWNSDGTLKLVFKNLYVEKVFYKIWQSCLAFLGIKEGAIDEYVQELDDFKGLSLLGLYIYLVYTYFAQDDIKNNLKNLKIFTLEMTDGLLQLIENVCLHSQYKKGYFSFIINKRDDNYLLQINVIDYANSNLTKDGISILNDKFYSHLNDDDIFKQYFKLAELKDFFEPEFIDTTKEKDSERFYGNYWDDYFYNRAENAAFHYGLQVFASIVRGYKGLFQVRSNYDFQCEDNQKYKFLKSELSYEESKELEKFLSDDKHCFPGTHYEVVFLISFANEQKNVGFNSKINEQAFDEILNYKVNSVRDAQYEELLSKLSTDISLSQNEKEKSIRALAKYFQSLKIHGLFINDKYSITQIDFKRLSSGQNMEFFCKALFLFIKEELDTKLKIAITGCSEECMLEFVRWFLIFYDKQNNCKEMENVEIYIVGDDSREDFLLSGTSLAISQGRVEKVCMSKGVFNQRQKIISQAVWRNVKENSEFTDDCFEIIPYDIIVNYDNTRKIFEDAVLKTLDTNLQSMDFGCKVSDCHVRIGSKIHITDNFYEAHSLFHSNYYTSRFAFLLAKKLNDNLVKDKGEKNVLQIKKQKLIIVGYETYSELLICETKKILNKTFGFDYVGHVIYDAGVDENFRLWKSEYAEANFINIVPINSTLSTHNKIISLYEKYEMKKENILANFAMILIRDNNSVRDNNLTALENHYWDSINLDERKIYTPLVDKEIDYFILIENQWELPLECGCCFPDNVMDEVPLIETNKSSVVPTFMIGIKPEDEKIEEDIIIEKYYRNKNNDRINLDIFDKSVLHYEHLCRNGNDYRYYINSESLYNNIEEQKRDDLNNWCKCIRSVLNYRIPRIFLEELLDSFLENHRKGGEVYNFINDHKKFLYFFDEEVSQTEAEAFLKELEDDIVKSSLKQKNLYFSSIKKVKDKISMVPRKEKIQSYDIIVSPVHHSNATWIDKVTESIFENMPAILHFDVQKEFRDNMKTKYSNLTTLYENLRSVNKAFEINFHFVDDTIISGRTFNRAKTLIQSLFPPDAFVSIDGKRPRVNLFKSVIVLFNRMSSSSQIQYVDRGMFFSYINIFVPNLRNHEDACIMCKLVTDMEKVKRRSATNMTAEFFERREIKHKQLSEFEYESLLSQKGKTDEQETRGYKRLYCNHRIFESISIMGESRNETEAILQVMVTLINEKIKEKNADLDEKMEWLISYLKIYSRPVVTFRKSFLEAYFKLAISMVEILVLEKCNETLFKKIYKFYEDFCVGSGNKQKFLDALIKTLLGGLGKVKSNYILRAEQITNVLNWYDRYVWKKGSEEYDDFLRWYILNIKRMVELSGDETKSIWLENLLLKGKEWKNKKTNKEFYNKYGIESSFGQYLYLENTRLIYDAVSDLNKNFYDGYNLDSLNDSVEELMNPDSNNLTHYYVSNFFTLVNLNKDFIIENNKNSDNSEKIEKYNKMCKERIVAMVKMYYHLNNNKVKKLSARRYEESESVKQIEQYYASLLRYMKESSGARVVSLFGANEQEDRLKEIKQFLYDKYHDEIQNDEEVLNLLREEESTHLKLYRISVYMNEMDDKNKEYDGRKVQYEAEDLLEKFQKNDEDIISIAKTVAIDMKNKRVILKIHNNYTELSLLCDEKHIQKVPVEAFYFYFEFSDEEVNDLFSVLRGIRNVLTFRDSIVKRVEEDFNNNLIQLTISSQKKAKDLSNDRAAGHTKMDEIKSFASQNLCDDFLNTDEKKRKNIGTMLKLLADSYCSHKFREMYNLAEKPIQVETINSGYLLDEYRKSLHKYSNVFENYTFTRLKSGGKYEETACIFCELQEVETGILNLEFEEVWVLFIVLLIQNAIEHGLVDEGTKKTDVRIYVDRRYIVVQSEAKSKEDVEKIKLALGRIPEGKAEGISLWVIDQCIKIAWQKYYWRYYITENFEKESAKKIKNILSKFKKLETNCVCIESDTKSKQIKIKLPIIFD